MKKVINFLLAVVITSALLAAAAFFVFNEKNESVSNDTPKVPYYEQNPPDNVGLLFRFGVKGSVFFDLDYHNSKISAILFNEKTTKQGVLDYGYTVDYVVDADYIFLADFIDRFGGLEFQNGDKLQRYTGVQITDMLENDKLTEKQLISTILLKINSSGFSKNDLMFLIKNTHTDLSYPSGYPLIANFHDLCLRINFVN